jgi:hypothetical protein
MNRSDVGMVNEVLCKLPCHNLACWIQEQERLASCPFSGRMRDKEEGPAVLPMVRAQRILAT